MQKKFITITTGNCDSDFYLVCHAACDEQGNFQWFLKDDPNSEHEVYLENQVYESFSTDSNWIKENAENKWLGCHCLLKDDKYTEMKSLSSYQRQKQKTFGKMGHLIFLILMKNGKK